MVPHPFEVQQIRWRKCCLPHVLWANIMTGRGHNPGRLGQCGLPAARSVPVSFAEGSSKHPWRARRCQSLAPLQPEASPIPGGRDEEAGNASWQGTGTWALCIRAHTGSGKSRRCCWAWACCPRSSSCRGRRLRRPPRPASNTRPAERATGTLHRWAPQSLFAALPCRSSLWPTGGPRGLISAVAPTQTSCHSQPPPAIRPGQQKSLAHPSHAADWIQVQWRCSGLARSRSGEGRSRSPMHSLPGHRGLQMNSQLNLLLQTRLPSVARLLWICLCWQTRILQDQSRWHLRGAAFIMRSWVKGNSLEKWRQLQDGSTALHGKVSHGPYSRLVNRLIWAIISLTSGILAKQSHCQTKCCSPGQGHCHADRPEREEATFFGGIWGHGKLILYFIL